MNQFVRMAARGSAIAACIGLLAASAAHADEIYKWVDKDGKTHYSSRPEDAAGAQTSSVRPPPPPAGGGPAPYTPSSNAEIIHRRSTAEPAPPPAQASEKRIVEVRVYGRESPEAKCALAREVLAGRAVRRDGKPIDGWNLNVAENDVRVYCPKTSK